MNMKLMEYFTVNNTRVYCNAGAIQTKPGILQRDFKIILSSLSYIFRKRLEAANLKVRLLIPLFRAMCLSVKSPQEMNFRFLHHSEGLEKFNYSILSGHRNLKLSFKYHQKSEPVSKILSISGPAEVC